MQSFTSLRDRTESDPTTSSKNDKRTISLLSAFMILTTWSTSSSNVLFPYTFGVLGVVFGPLLMSLAFLASWKMTRLTVQAARATRSSTFGDLGSNLLGWHGRVLFEGSQILFQQLFLPVAIVLVSGAVQSLAGYENVVSADVNNPFSACNGNVVVLFGKIVLLSSF